MNSLLLDVELSSSRRALSVSFVKFGPRLGLFRQVQPTAWLVSSSSDHNSVGRSEELGRPADEAIGLQLQSGELKMIRYVVISEIWVPSIPGIISVWVDSARFHNLV